MYRRTNVLNIRLTATTLSLTEAYHMIVIRWNIRGYTLSKGTAVSNLLADADIVCLMQTRRRIEPDQDREAATSVATPRHN